jgi:hypothetical protein
MWDGFIGKHIQRSNRNMLTSNLALLAVPVAIVAIGGGYWFNFFGGPKTTPATTINQLKEGQTIANDYVSVKGDKTIDTGVTEITTTTRRGVKTGERTSANMVALALGDRLLIVKAKPANAKDTNFTGKLKPIPSDLYAQLITPVVTKNPGAKEMFVPYMLDQVEDYKFGGYMGLALGLPCAALAIWNLQKVGRRWGKPENHPIAKQLSADGDAATIASQVEQEVNAPNTHTISNTTITPNWVFRKTTYSLDALRLEDLVWFYQKVTTHRTNGVPTGKTYSTMLFDRAGRTFEMNANESQVQEIMTILYDKAPWAISGYSDDLQKMWKKERESMISAVDERRQAA